MQRVKFANQLCNVRIDRYPSGQNLIQLIAFGGPNDGEYWATASINMPGYTLEKDEVIIKDYSENHGMLEALVKAGIVQEIVYPDGGQKVIPSGFVYVPVCKMLMGDIK